MDEQFMQWLYEKTGAKSEQLLIQIIAELFGVQDQEGLKLALALLHQQYEQEIQSAKQGAKLNYIKLLRGGCPEGYEMGYFKTGGTICKRCVKKHQEGDQIDNSPIPQQFKSGKKVEKKACGGSKLMPKKEFGGPAKKKYINPNDTIHAGKQIYDIGNGKSGYKKLTNELYHKLNPEDQARVDRKDQMRRGTLEDGENPNIRKKKIK